MVRQAAVCVIHSIMVAFGEWLRSERALFEQRGRGTWVMTNLYLIRHADYTFGLEDGKYRDLGLTPLGVKQAELLRDRLATTGEIKADVLIASTMPRARQTAEILAPALGLPVVLD